MLEVFQLPMATVVSELCRSRPLLLLFLQVYPLLPAFDSGTVDASFGVSGFSTTVSSLHHYSFAAAAAVSFCNFNFLIKSLYLLLLLVKCFFFQ